MKSVGEEARDPQWSSCAAVDIQGFNGRDAADAGIDTAYRRPSVSKVGSVFRQ